MTRYAYGLLAILAGCSYLGTAETVAPVVTGALCTLAADQGSAEPGWEIYVCSVLDAKGNVTDAKFTIKTKAGAGPVAPDAGK